MIATTTGSPAILPVPAGVRATKHLRGPKTVRDLPKQDLDVGTVLEVADQREDKTTVERKKDILTTFLQVLKYRVCAAGASVQDMFFRNDIFFDGVLKPKGMSFPAAYQLHVNQKYQQKTFCKTLLIFRAGRL